MLAIEIEKLPAPAQKILAPGAPAPMRMMAAKGIVPGLKPADLVTVIAALSESDDPKVAEAASQTLGNLPPPLITGALTADLESAVIDKLVERYGDDTEVVTKLLRMPRIGQSALESLADRADEALGEIIATNEQRLLACPTVIEKLYMNKRVRMSTADRLLELAVRNGLELSFPAFKEAAAAIANELIAEPTEEPTYDDVLFNEAEAIAAQVKLESEEDDTHVVDEEGEEQLKDKFKPLYARIAEMTIAQKIRRAQLGTAAERLLLVRDTNSLVAVAAVKSPSMRDGEAVLIAASRNVGEEVLREIAKRREFTRNYQVKLHLVMNPRTPFSFAARIVPLLRENDLRQLGKSKNVSGAISQAVRQQLERKKS